MVSGASGTWNNSQFNLAADSQRQPGSAFKVFTLAEALRTGEYGPSSVIDSAPQDFIVPNSGGKEHFIVHNFGNTYSGPITLQEATSISDNTVFSQVGIHVGTSRIARLAKQMGIRTPVSHNDAMILGGLTTGVSPLDMAHAYETIAEGGRRVYNPVLGDMQGGAGPTGIASITCTSTACGHPGQTITDHPTYKRVLPQWVATTEHSMLEGPVSPGGTAPLAAIPGVVVAGKTGTTSNYVDAWFVGWTPQLTTAVWVGYPNKAVPMLTTYNGSPVEGGTYPAIIWNSFMTNALQILANEQAAANQGKSGTTSTSSTASGSGSSSSGNPTATATGGTNTPAPANGTNNGNGTGGAGGGTGAGTGAGTGGGTGAGTGGGTGGGTGAGTGGGTGGGTGAGTGGGGGGTGGGGGGTGGGTGGTGGGSGGAGLGGAPSG
jgi:penicillin-binding protein 1A